MSEPSDLAELERAVGAVFEPDQTGRVGAFHFGNPHGEYTAAATEAAVFDLSERAQLELTGRDRQKFLHNFCTNEIRTLQPGQGCEAFITSIQGKVLAHVFVFAAPHGLWLDSVPGSEERIASHLTKYLITEDVEIHSRTAEWGELFVTGPEASGRLAALKLSVAALPPTGHLLDQSRGFPLAIRRVDFTGMPGYLLCAPRTELTGLWQALTGGGFRPAGMAAFHALRVEACMPLYGLDISEANFAQEVGRTSVAVSFTKGCYLGQEPIARIDALGHVNQELRGIRLAAGPLPLPGSAVLPLGDDREIGKITSSAISFSHDLPVALAYLKRNHFAPGTQVRVRTPDEEFPGVVYWCS
jgi:hypothetical protein